MIDFGEEMRKWVEEDMKPNPIVYIMASKDEDPDETVYIFTEEFTKDLQGRWFVVPLFGNYQLNTVDEFMCWLGADYVDHGWTVHHVTLDPEYPAIKILGTQVGPVVKGLTYE